MVAMAGWWMRARILASERNRSTISGSRASSGQMAFTATSRSSISIAPARSLQFFHRQGRSDDSGPQQEVLAMAEIKIERKKGMPVWAILLAIIVLALIVWAVLANRNHTPRTENNTATVLQWSAPAPVHTFMPATRCA
jgi:uncharacterized integral membrane protein